MTQIKPTKEQLLKRFAEIQKISEQEAEKLIGGDTADQISKKITEFTKEKIYSQMPKMNRKQRRAAKKKAGKGRKKVIDAATQTIKKINYIELIEKLKELNKKREEEENENAN